LSVQKALLWELLGLPHNSKFITLPQPNNFLLLVDEKIHEHMKFFNEHLKLQIVVIMGLNYLQKLGPKSKITNREVFVEN
jgi:hypothetical protein